LEYGKNKPVKVQSLADHERDSRDHEFWMKASLKTPSNLGGGRNWNATASKGCV
jgi:hypothetical protein